MAEHRTIEVVQTVDLPGNRITYIVKAPPEGEPPFELGETVERDGDLFEITGVEMMMSNPPQPIYRGHQSIMLKPVLLVPRAWDAEAAIERVRAIKAEDAATTSRDYGRGYAQALRDVNDAIEGKA